MTGADTTTRAVHVRVSGRVQGVGYRANTDREARRRGLHGWVRNRADGSVELWAQGPAAAVDDLLAWCRRGPPAARVEGLTVDEAAPDAALTGFLVRPTA